MSPAHALALADPPPLMDERCRRRPAHAPAAAQPRCETLETVWLTSARPTSGGERSSLTRGWQ